MKAYVVQAPKNPGTEVKNAIVSLNIDVTFVDQWDDVDFLWRGHMKGISEKVLENLNKKGALINHFTHSHLLDNKISMVNVFKKLDLLNYLPKTYLFDELKNLTNEMIITKPATGWGGEGIKIQKSQECSYIPNTLYQKYIENPLLYNGYKFDVRVFVLVLTDGKKIYPLLCDKAFARLSTIKYNLDFQETKNFYKTHLTNIGVQNQCSSNIVDFDEIKNTLKCDIDVFKECFKKCFECINPKKYSCSFQLFGCDVMFDQNSQGYLLEINTNPVLYTCNDVLSKMIPCVLHDALKIVFEFRKTQKLNMKNTVFSAIKN